MSIPTEAAIREELARVLASAAFNRAGRAERLLTFLVEQTIAGRSQYLKEYTLGVEALGRRADFDPRGDPIARVEASRLRSKLELYYATEGKNDPLVICLPKGSYVPVFRDAQQGVPVSDAITIRRQYVPWLAAGAAALVVLSIAAGAWLTRAAPQPTRALLKLDVALGAAGRLSTEVGGNLALSPDGRVLVFLALHEDGSTRLHARHLEDLNAHELPGTIGARSPFFSPDGRWIGFVSDGKLKKTLVEGGGSPTTLADASDLLGASWSERGEIIAKLTSASILWRVPEDGGAPEVIVDTADEGTSLRWPQVLPGARAVVLTAMRGLRPSVEVLSLEDGTRRTLIPSGLYGRYLESGHLVYVDGGTLFAVPFDVDALDIRGTPVPVLDGVAYSPSFGFAQFTAAATGVAVYQRAGGGGRMTVARLGRDGAIVPLLTEAGHYQWPRISPDGGKLAIAKLEGGEFGIWIQDLAAATRSRLGNGATPVWTQDQRFVLYENTPVGLFAQRADGATPGQRLVEGNGRLIPWSFTADGTRLAYYALTDDTAADIWIVSVDSNHGQIRAGQPELFRRTAAYELYPTFSPDGRWIAYGSNESGAWEVYVRAFPDNGSQVRVSNRGGRVPAWSRTSSELVYETNDHRLMVASYRVQQDEFRVDAVTPWSTVQLADSIVLPAFDLAPDGDSVIALLPHDDGGGVDDHVTVLVDFFAHLRSALP